MDSGTPERRLPSFSYCLSVCCVVTLGFYTASYMRIPIVPLYAKALGIGTSTIGLINSVFFFTSGCLSFPSGLLSDRLGRKRIAVVGTIIITLTAFSLPLARTAGSLMVIYFFFGVGMSAYGPTMMGYVADVSPVSHLGRSYGWYTTALYTGMSMGPAVGGWIAGRYSYTEVFVFSGIITAVLILALLFLLPFAPTPEEHDREAVPKMIESAGEVFRNRPLWACWIVTLGLCFGLGMFITFIPLHARHAAIPVTAIGMIFFVQGGANALSRIPFGHWSDRTSDRSRLVVVGGAGIIASMLGFGASTSLWQFLLFAVVLGGGLALAFTSVGALIAVAVPPHSRGLAMGGYNTCIYFGIMLASATMGTVIEKTSYRAAFWSSALVITLFVSVFILLLRGVHGPHRGTSTATD